MPSSWWQHVGVKPCADLLGTRDGRRIEVAGLVLVLQKPGSDKGVMFITLEDENGSANIVVWAAVFEANRRTNASALLASIDGRDAGAIKPATRDFR